MQVPLPLQLFHLDGHLCVILPQRVLPQPQDLLRLVVLLHRQSVPRRRLDECRLLGARPTIMNAAHLLLLLRAKITAGSTAVIPTVMIGVGGGGRLAASAALFAASLLLVLRLLLGQQLSSLVNLLPLLADLLLAFGELLEGVAIRPVLLEAGSHPLGNKLAQPQPVRHAFGPRILPLNPRLFN